MKNLLLLISGFLALSGCSSISDNSQRNIYIPSGTSLNATTVTGADVSKIESSQILININGDLLLSNGTSINYLNNCRAIINVIADYSSERIYGKLEKISCSIPNHYIFEKNADGYIADSDGKAGIKAIKNPKGLLELNSDKKITVIFTKPFALEDTK